MKNINRKALCLVLVLSMVLGCISAVFADEPEDKGTINLVTLGDSVPAGYGQDTVPSDPYGAAFNGFNIRVEDAYPDRVADALTKKGYQVNLTQLAASGQRVYEIRMYLDPTYQPDKYYEAIFGTEQLSTWIDSMAATLIEGYEDGNVAAVKDRLAEMTTSEKRHLIADYYTEAITNADIITFEAGCNDLLSSINVAMNMGISFDPLQFLAKYGRHSQSDMLCAKVKDAFRNCFPSGCYSKLEKEDPSKLSGILNTITYGILDATLNYDYVMAKIYQLNPDAQIVVLPNQCLVPLQMAAKLPFTDEPFELGKFGNALTMIVNDYQSIVSPWARTVRYADTKVAHSAKSALEDFQASANVNNLSPDIRANLDKAMEAIITDLHEDYKDAYRSVISNPLKSRQLIQKMKDEAYNTYYFDPSYQSNELTAEAAAILDATQSAIVLKWANGGIENQLSDEERAFLYPYINCKLMTCNRVALCHPSKAGHQAKADAIMDALQSAEASPVTSGKIRAAEIKQWKEDTEEEIRIQAEAFKTIADSLKNTIDTSIKNAMEMLKQSFKDKFNEAMNNRFPFPGR